MRTVAALHANGPRTISSDAVGGSGSFRCMAVTSARASFTTPAFLNSPKDRAWAIDYTHTSWLIRWVAKFSPRQELLKATYTPWRCCHITARRSVVTAGPL